MLPVLEACFIRKTGKRKKIPLHATALDGVIADAGSPEGESLPVFSYDGHAVNLWCKSTRGVVADEPHSNSQGLYREVQARGRDSEIVA